jgi:hypothetical protein
MRHWKLSLLTLLAILGFTLFIHSQQAQNNPGKAPKQKDQTEEVNVNEFPTIDYAAEKQIKGAERIKRDKRGKKYNSKYSPVIDEGAERIAIFIDWERGLPALPVEKSDAIIIGEVVEANAYLSEDQTQIYSQFVIRVEDVAKNNGQVPISPQTNIAVERLGGRVRFPSGKFAVANVSQQDLPRVGRRYVLFLTHDLLMSGRYDEDFFILTGYELRNDKVFPLDKVSSGHPISSYKDKDRESFLDDLALAISNASAKKN